MPKRPPISELVQKTPGAQSRDEARRSVAARRDKHRSSQERDNEDFTAPESLPCADTEAFAHNFFERLMDKDRPPVRGRKPRLVSNTDETDPEKSK